MKIFSFLLFPFACLYNAITTARNFLYNYGIFQSEVFDVPTVCVGNLRVGGTGKTPFIELIISEYVKSEKKLSVLSRGYGRKTKGFRIADESSSSIEIGDEPFQYYSKYKQNINVYVDEKRTRGIQLISKNEPDIEVILLDDAYQHRPLSAKVNILLTEFKRPFYKDFLLPLGRLRESRKGADRADILVVTKCPDSVSLNERKIIELQIKKYTKNITPIFYSKIVYSTPLLGIGDISEIPGKFILVCGIDNPAPFIVHCEKEFLIHEKIIYTDHHDFSNHDILNIKARELPVLTTEKDFMRLKSWSHEFQTVQVYYIPIKIEFLEGQDQFFKILADKLST